MKYKNLSTSNLKVAELQSQYKSTWHVVHAVLSIALWPWIVIWALQHHNNRKHNQLIDQMIVQQIDKE